jgi:hypothetical protein
MAAFTSRLDADRERAQAKLEAGIRERVETVLADQAAQRQYEFEAKRRLYAAIGPLRFQLLLACRELAGRVVAQGTAQREQYATSIDGYYGRSTLYRILRPLCLSELIERQIAFADFSVDPAALDLLRLRKAAFTAFSGELLVRGHPKVDWSRQSEHVFVDNLSKSANALVVTRDEGQRAMRFHEFEALLAENAVSLSPFPELLARFSPQRLPLFWLRLVAYGALCNEFINMAGTLIGFERRTYPIRDLLAATPDPTIQEDLDDYTIRCEALWQIRL